MSQGCREIGPLGVLVLSLLAERDMHPYEMIQTLRTRQEDRWVKLSPGSLYHQVERLAVAGLAQAVGTQQDGNRPPRTTYRLTESGRGVLGTWVAQRLATVENPYLSFSLALGEIAEVPRERAVELLTARRTSLQEQYDSLDEAVRRARTRGAERVYLLAHEHMLALLATERDYVTSVIDDINAKELTWPK